jgi:hypothetical protein
MTRHRPIGSPPHLARLPREAAIGGMIEMAYQQHMNIGQGNLRDAGGFTRRLTRIGWKQHILTAVRSAASINTQTNYANGLNDGVYESAALNAVLFMYNITSKTMSFSPNLSSVQDTVDAFMSMTGRAELGNVRKEFAGFKAIIRIAARIYKNLVINMRRQRCFFHLKLSYMTANETHGSSKLACLVKLKANENIIAAEVLYLAIRIAKMLKDTIQYDDNIEGHAILNNVFIRIVAGSGFAAMTHSVRGGISVDDFYAYTSRMDDPAVIASFKGMKRLLDENNRRLASPNTKLNCLLSALFMARDQIMYPSNELQGLHNFVSKVSALKSKIYRLEMNPEEALFDMIDGFAEHALYVGYTIKVHNMFYETFYMADGKSTDERTIPVSKKKHIHIMLFAGHALAIIRKESADLQRRVIRNVFHAKCTIEQRRLNSNLRGMGQDILVEEPLAYGVYDIETLCIQDTLGDEVVAYMIGWKSEITANHNVMICEGLRTCIVKFFDWLYKNCSKYYVFYAHNGGKFDIAVMMNYIFSDQKRFKLIRILMQNGRVISLKLLLIRSHVPGVMPIKTVIEFRDSYAMISASQDKIGKSMNIKTLKSSMNHDIINEHNYREQIDIQNITKYLYKDVQGLWEILHHFDSAGKGAFGFSPLLNCLTTSSIARLLFLSRFYDSSEMPLIELTKEEDELNRLAYHGGISETLVVGEQIKTLTYGDIKSLYPYMMQFPLPYGRGWPMKVNEANFKRFFGFLWVQFRGGRKKMFNPLYVKRPGRGLFGGVAKEWTKIYIFSEELRFAYENREFFNYEFIFLEGNCYSKGPVLKEASKVLFNLKAQQTKGTALYEFYKLVINSLYGFPAAKREGVSVDVTENPRVLLKHFWTGCLQQVRTHKSFYMYKALQYIDISFRYVPIGTAITAYGRAFMNRIRMQIELAGGSTYQIDTDGLVTDLSPEELMAAGVDWGYHWGGLCHDLAGEDDDIVITSGVFIAPKIYALKGFINGEPFEVCKFKGFPKGRWDNKEMINDTLTYSGRSPNGTQVLDYDAILHLLKGPIAYEQLRFIGGSSMWMMQVPTLVRKLAVVVISGVINKGTVDTDGVVINPDI